MNIQFATCERHRALEYLQRVYPSREIKDEGLVSECLDLVEADVVRIQDPMMHGSRIGVIPSTNWTDDHRSEVMDKFGRLQAGGDK